MSSARYGRPLTNASLFRYTYDTWNRLVGVWYDDCSVDGNGRPDVAAERIAQYEYDGLFRRIEKTVSKIAGTGVVHGSDAGVYDYDDATVLNQFGPAKVPDTFSLANLLARA